MTPGTPHAGGLFVARYFIGDQAYALIVSPKDAGEIAVAKWNTAKREAAGTTSYVDGLANTDVMATAGSKLAKQIRALRIGGFDDWFLPSRLESLLLFGEVLSEFEPDWYWTSTQSAGDGEYAWIQHFTSGLQSHRHKAYACRARAVRRVPI